MAASINVPEGARFSCRSCGRCCTGWAVPVDQATVDRLLTRNWGGNPFAPGVAGGEPWRIKLVRGRCFFLDGENRCRIHTEISYEAKPAACRAFPLAVLEVSGERYARLSHWCPTVTANQGKDLSQQSRWLQETARQTDRRTAAFKINEETGIGPRDLRQVHQALRGFLGEKGLPMSDRLAAAASLVSRLDGAAKGRGNAAVADLLAAVESEGMAALAEQTRRESTGASAGPMFWLYLGQDCRSGRLFRIGRFFALFLFNIGLLRLHSRAMAAGASRRRLRRTAFDPPTANNELLTRYLCSKLDSRRYLAGEATLVEGFNLLVAAYAVINVLARTRAASAGRTSCDDEDVRLAVESADLLVVEHPALHHGKMFKHLTGVALGSPGLCGAVLARLERGQG